MWRMALAGWVLGIGLGGSLSAEAQSCAPQSIRWETGGEAHVTTLIGRLRNGCPVLEQERGPVNGPVRLAQGGVDCDCDLMIDGREALFARPHPVAARRLAGLCRANRAAALDWQGAADLQPE